MAAAAWSWVEKMLQEVQVTSAPRAVRVSMRTAVWMAGIKVSLSFGLCADNKHTHVKTTGNAGTGEGLVSTVLLTDGHETGHLNLGELDLAATEGGERLSGVNNGSEKHRGLEDVRGQRP